ncbi:unnamed protein product, partial [marine sediment metagenome]
FYTENSRNRGKDIHKATEYLDLGTLDWDSVHKYKPYIRSYQQFLKRHFVTILGVELKVFNKELWYAGILDRHAEMDGERCLLSLKSGKYAWWHDLQEIAYNLTDGEILPMYGVYLDPDGECAVKKKLGRPNLIKIWEACVLVYHDKHRTKRAI